MQETELIEALKRGRDRAFEELVELYNDKVFNTALGFLQNAEDAEEIAQDVFIKIYQNIGQFRGDAKLSTWIYRITVAQSLDFLRKKKRQKRGGFLLRVQKSEEQWDQADFHHPGVVAEQKENAALLFKAIRDLPEQQQAAFLLQKLEGLSHLETAEVLKTTVSAVESLLHRAKANLRKTLEEHFKKQK